MVNFTLILALLCTFSWISVSVSQFNTVEVQSGEEVTLLCTNFTNSPTHVTWFRLANEPNVSCISSMSSSESNASLWSGFQNGKFTMKSNITDLFLKITPVDFSDSGLYFCGEYNNGQSVIKSATYLKVREVLAELTNQTYQTNPTCWILGALVVFLVMVIIVLVVKIGKLHAAQHEGQNPQHSENLGSEALNYAAIHFRPKAKSSRRFSAETDVEPDVVYAATR